MKPIFSALLLSRGEPGIRGQNLDVTLKKIKTSTTLCFGYLETASTFLFPST
jgi:hypothetical protein